MATPRAREVRDRRHDGEGVGPFLLGEASWCARSAGRGCVRRAALSVVLGWCLRRPPGALRKPQTADRRGRTLTTDDVISIIAVGACLVAFIACAVAHYLAVSV
jgi:hypothetical protein